MTVDAWVTLAVVVITVGVLIVDRFDPALVMGGAVLALYVSGVIDSGQLLAGIANESLAIVAALYVLAGAADITGAFDGVTSKLLGDADRNRPRAELLRVCAPSAGVSAFIANTPLVAMLAPRVVRWCRRTGRSPSLYLMPLSYAVILGGSMTMIGTSVNLFVNDLIDSAGLGRLGIFSIIGVGLPLTIGCVLLMVLLGPRLLKARTAPGEVRAGNEREFTVEMTIPFDSAMAGATVAEAGLRNLDGVFLVEVERAERVIAAVGPDEPLAVGDRL
ncbi:SLC13 family permease, partial [Mycolicibacterium poriferae]|uniref:SLC13 family permease n=2 Tax=Mycolicibacterium poriferae TaxID=39694 RepID=UPI0024BB02B5